MSQTAIDRLTEALGFDPNDDTDATECMQVALREIQDEEKQSKISKAKKLLRRGMELRKEMLKAEEEFAEQKEEFENNLGKLLDKVEQLSGSASLEST